jgi:D-3-phosphoglycerate dehydrogenase / 2-oxoglutarate reductase
MRAVFVDCSAELRRIIAGRRLPVPASIFIHDGDPSREDLLALARGASVLLVEHTILPNEVLDACPSVRGIIFMGTGAGTYIDLEGAARRGIRVLTVPGYGDRAVAEHALALLMCAARNISEMDRNIRAGHWLARTGLQLRGARIAVIGLGGIGSTFAEMVSALGANVVAWNRTRRHHRNFEPDLDAALQGADVVSLHLMLNAETRGLIDNRRLYLPRAGFVLVNTARADLVDERALLNALAAGQIGHAALDVFPVEPLPSSNPYRDLANVTLTPHAAFMTDDAYAELWTRTVAKLQSLEHG